MGVAAEAKLEEDILVVVEGNGSQPYTALQNLEIELTVNPITMSLSHSHK